MAYTKKTWVKGNTPLSAENFNHMEQGIADAHSSIAQLNSDKTWTGKRGTKLHKIDNVVFCTISQILDNPVGNHVYQNVFLDEIPDTFRPNNNVYSAFAVVSGGYYIGNGYINIKTDGSNEAILSTSRSQNAEYNLTLTWICK